MRFYSNPSRLHRVQRVAQSQTRHMPRASGPSHIDHHPHYLALGGVILSLSELPVVWGGGSRYPRATVRRVWKKY
eukprot:6561866-Prymnesium_polylepis.2